LISPFDGTDFQWNDLRSMPNKSMESTEITGTVTQLKDTLLTAIFSVNKKENPKTAISCSFVNFLGSKYPNRANSPHPRDEKNMCVAVKNQGCLKEYSWRTTLLWRVRARFKRNHKHSQRLGLPSSSDTLSLLLVF
jgi:hypothetical protein